MTHHPFTNDYINLLRQHYILHSTPSSDQHICNKLRLLLYKQTTRRIVRHHALNDVIASTFTAAKILVAKEPADMSRLDTRNQIV